MAVCEPMTALRIEGPADAARNLAPILLGAGARILGQQATDERSSVMALIQAGRVHEIQNRMPGATGGEGVLEASFAGYHPVAVDPPPARRRTRPNPFDRVTYLAAFGRSA